MKKAAVLVSDNLLPDAVDGRVDRFELVEEMEKLVPAFADKGIQLERVRWREAASRAHEFDAMMPLFVWDYFEENEAAFLSEMKKASETTKIFNNFEILKWNCRKSYLDELAQRGAPTIRTIVLDRVTQTGIAKAFETLGEDTIVIKPLVGGGAWRQVLYKKGDPFPAKSELPPQEAMVQAFLPSVKTEGEYSFLYFGGQLSHALVKRPKDGDYRIQSSYGGTEEPYAPTAADRESARTVLAALDYAPLYARVDLLRGTDGKLKLIELELIEPYLYLPYAEGEGGENRGAQRFAAALAKRLGL